MVSISTCVWEKYAAVVWFLIFMYKIIKVWLYCYLALYYCYYCHYYCMHY